jgi:aminopeptidase N
MVRISGLAGLLVGSVLAATLAAAADPPAPEPADASGLCARAKAAIARATESTGGAPAAKSSDDPRALETDVLHYRLELDVDPPRRFLEGANTMTVACAVDDVTAFRFWLHPALNVTALTVDGEAAAWRRLDERVLEAELGRDCDLGERFELRVAYRGFPVTAGLSSIVFASQGGWPVVATLSEPWFASTWWPVKEDSRDKATGELSITVPEELSVVANGVLRDVEPVAGGRRRFHWATDYPTSPYLFAFAATRFSSYSSSFLHEGGEMPVELHLYPASDTEDNRERWESVLAMLDIFGDLFGPYPFLAEKYAIYEFPWHGGMEHQTATGQGGGNAFAESLSAHELAHQWWGDLVTCATWSDIWLNEGFATYAEALWSERGAGAHGASALRSAMAARRPSNLEGTVYIASPTDVQRIFSHDLSYRKGAWVLHMLRGVLGSEAFFDLLAAYRERFAYGSATTADFQGVAEEVAGRDLGWFFAEWVYGGGAPAYRSGWREHEIAGRRYLEISLEQTQPDPAFTMPLELEILAGGRPLRTTLWNHGRLQHFLLPVPAPVDAVAVDPDDRILTRSVLDAAFVDGPPKVVAAAPAPGSLLRAGDPLSLAIAFHEDVVIGVADVRLLRADGVAVALDVSYDPASFTATVTSLHPLSGGRHELLLGDTVVDASGGLALDGEMVDAAGQTLLPSGDGLPGGAAVIGFEVLGSRRPSQRLRPAP